MTTNTLAAIRERADEAKQAYERRQVALKLWIDTNAASAERELDRLSQECAMRVSPLTNDIAALLAIVDALTARAEAAEAALRPFAELLPRYAEYVAECRADDMICSNLKGWVDWFGVDNDDLVAWCKQAADALAAHAANGESAGNGGA